MSSNMSIQPGNMDRSEIMKKDKMNSRPSMKEDDHPEHNMPAPQHDGVMLPFMGSTKGAINSSDNQ